MSEELVKEITGLPDVISETGEIRAWREIEEGLNSIYILEAESQEYVLKIRTNHRNEIGWFRAEPVIYRGLEDVEGVPSPEIVYSDVSADKVNAFFIMEKLEGVNPAGFKHELSPEVLREALRNIGRFLGRIHSEFEIKEYGMLEASGSELESEDSPRKWTWHVQGAVEELEDHIDEGWGDDIELDLPSKSKIERVLPERPESVLLHLDNRLDNILMNGGEVSAFLDWSHPEAGHYEYDIVRAEYLLVDYDLDHLSRDVKQSLRDSLYSGYEEVREIDREGFEERKKLYRKITVIWILAGFPNWKSTLNSEERKEMRHYLLKKAESELNGY